MLSTDHCLPEETIEAVSNIFPTNFVLVVPMKDNQNANNR